MTQPLTPQEQLRSFVKLLRGIPSHRHHVGYPEPQPPTECEKVADQIELLIPEFEAQSQLLAEAREALELIILAYVQHSGETPIVAKALDVLAKLKAASGE